MTEVSFYFNLVDKSAYTCRLLRKAVLKGSRVAVTGDEAVLRKLDRDLWTFSETDFVPHCMAPCGADVLAASPVVFCLSTDTSPHHQVLVNIGDEVPAGFERFERLVEVVAAHAADRLHSRRRWKYYRDRGYAIASHEVAPKGSH